MKKEGFDNKILGGMQDRFNRVKGKMTKQFGKTIPFASEKISRQQQIQDYEALKPADILRLVQQYGAEAVEEFRLEMEQERRKYARR